MCGAVPPGEIDQRDGCFNADWFNLPDLFVDVRVCAHKIRDRHHVRISRPIAELFRPLLSLSSILVDISEHSHVSSGCSGTAVKRAREEELAALEVAAKTLAQVAVVKASSMRRNRNRILTHDEWRNNGLGPTMVNLQRRLKGELRDHTAKCEYSGRVLGLFADLKHLLDVISFLASLFDGLARPDRIQLDASRGIRPIGPGRPRCDHHYLFRSKACRSLDKTCQSFRVLGFLIRASELTRLSKMDALDRPVLSRSSTTRYSRCEILAKMFWRAIQRSG